MRKYDTLTLLYWKQLFSKSVYLTRMTENVEPVNVGPSHGGDNALYENNDDDPDAGEDVPQKNSMLFAEQGLEDDDHADDGYTNNEYVEPEDLNPDEFEDDAWVNSTYVKNITAGFNRYTSPTATEDLKVGDIFELKVKLLQAITEWSIKRGVSFMLLFSDYSTNKVYFRWLPLLEDFDACDALSWGGAVLVVLYRSLYKVSMIRLYELHSITDIVHFYLYSG